MAAHRSQPGGPHYASNNPMTAPGQPGGFFLPGTKVTVGSHRVVVERYLSEGGFAHVYVVQVPTKDGRQQQAVLKRVAVPDKDALADMRTEVETMKKLKGHKHIVTYIDSHASQLKGGGYEVFLLMEFCSGGGLIDFMNTRLKNRLTEPEILQIFSDAAEGVACMHYLKPPLCHRDLKIENILLASDGTGKRIYKLCDFGSTAPPRPPARSMTEGALIEEDIQKHTTMQYRSPEMIDVYRKKPIDEKSDIWALGVFLYKLCYYTTPFEEVGQMAILTASFKYPAHPRFSDRLKRLIAIMLMEDPKRRPNIYEVLKEVCGMRGMPVPVKDIYSQRTESESRSHQQLPPREPDVKSPPMVGASVTLPDNSQQALPEVKPMRRGRPTALPPTTKSASSSKTDPFAALDSKDYATRVAAVESLSNRFPAVEDFSLLQSKASKYDFMPNSPTVAKKDDLKQRVTNALADEAFGNIGRSNSTSARLEHASSSGVSRASSTKKKPSAPDATLAQNLKSPPMVSPQPMRPAMVSTGTMTGDSPVLSSQKPSEISSKPIWRVPTDRPSRGFLSRLSNPGSRPKIHARSASSSSFAMEVQLPQSPSSSRPSLEGSRPTFLDIPESIPRSKSTDSSAEHRPHYEPQPRSHTDPPELQHPTEMPDEQLVASDMDFLRAMEDESQAKSKSSHHRRASSTLDNLRALKPSGMPSVSRGKLSGKLGEAFKRFESNGTSSQYPERTSSRSHSRSPNILPASQRQTSPAADPSSHQSTHPDTLSLPPAATSNEVAVEEIDESELPPEVRRELERRRLSAEEKRVAEAAAAWRAKQAAGGGRPSARASAIQDRVKNLLDESSASVPIRRTAAGYGKYTDSAPPTDEHRGPAPPPKDDFIRPNAAAPPPIVVPKRNTTLATGGNLASPIPPPKPPRPSSSVQPTSTGGSIRPNIKAKPVALRTGTPLGSPAVGSIPSKAFNSVPPPQASSANAANITTTVAPAAGADEDWETDFSKRYPSLSLEMVEAEISGQGQPQIRRSQPVRMRDV